MHLALAADPAVTAALALAAGGREPGGDAGVGLEDLG